MSDIDRNYFIENYATITSTEMIDFIEKYHPEDRKLIAEECLKDYADKELGDTSYWNMGVEGQVVFSDDWSMNIAYKYKKFIDNDGFNKADSSNITVSGNWQATDMALLTLYVNYDATGKDNRLDANSPVLVGADGDDNRWSYGMRMGVQF